MLGGNWRQKDRPEGKGNLILQAESAARGVKRQDIAWRSAPLTKVGKPIPLPHPPAAHLNVAPSVGTATWSGETVGY